MSTSPILRQEVIKIYRELLSLAKNYPTGYAGARAKIHAAFSAQTHLTDEGEIRRGIERAEFVRKEIETL